MVEKKEEREEMDRMFEDLQEEAPKKKKEKRGFFLNKKILTWVGIPILLFIIGLGTTYFIIQGRESEKEEVVDLPEIPFEREKLDLKDLKEEIELKPEFMVPELPEVLKKEEKEEVKAELPEVLKEEKEEKEEKKEIEKEEVKKEEVKEAEVKKEEVVKKVEPKKVVVKKVVSIPKKRIRHIGFPRIPENLDLSTYYQEVETEEKEEEPSSIRALLREAKIKVEKSEIEPAKEQLRKAYIFALKNDMKEASRLASEAIRITELEEKR